MTADDTIYQAEGYMDDDLHEADIVEWYEARPVTVSTASPAQSMPMPTRPAPRTATSQ